MKIEEVYLDALENGYHLIIIFLELAFKKGVLHLNDDNQKIYDFLENSYRDEWKQEIHLAGIQRGYWQ